MTNILQETVSAIKNWWLFVIFGVLLIISGIYVMTVPLESYITLAIFFSVLIFVNGVFDIAFSISNSKVLQGWGWYLAGGVMEVLMGIVLMIYPEITMVALPLILGFWLMYGAVSTISGAFELKSYYIKDWGWVLLLGILLMIFSFIVIANPYFGSSTIVVMTSIGITLYGISYIFIGLKLKKVKDFGGNIKKAVISNLDGLKKQVLTAIENANDNASSKAEIDEKFDSFKDSIK